MDLLQKENETGKNREGKHPNWPLKCLTATSIIGDHVHNGKDEHLGKIEDIMINVNTGQIEYVVIGFGGILTIGEKYFAIPWRLMKADPAKKMFILDQPKEVLEKAPGFDMSHWPETNWHGEETYWSFY